MPQSNRERDFGDVALLDLATSGDGGTIFVRQVPRRTETHSSGATYMNTTGAGELLALDASLAERERIDIEGLVVMHRLDGINTRAVKIAYDPRGWAFAIRCGSRIADFGFGQDKDGRSRSGEAWATYDCEHARMFSSARYHPTNGNLVFVEEGSAVRTAHSHLDWPGVAAYAAVMDDERIAAIGPKYLYVYDRAARAEAFRVPIGPGFSVCLLPDARVAALSGRKVRLRVYDRAGQELSSLVAGIPFSARLEPSPSGIIALVDSYCVAFVDPPTARVATLPKYDFTPDLSRPGQFAWIDDRRAAVVWPGTAVLSVIELGDLFSILPRQKWKSEKPKSPKG